MDTRERLKQQRRKGWRDPAVFFGLGFGSGLWLGFSTCAGTPEISWPAWAIALVAYGLGGLTVLLYWWQADLRRKPSQEESATQSQ